MTHLLLVSQHWKSIQCTATKLINPEIQIHRKSCVELMVLTSIEKLPSIEPSDVVQQMISSTQLDRVRRILRWSCLVATCASRHRPTRALPTHMPKSFSCSPFRLLTDNVILMVYADLRIFEEGHVCLCKQSGIVSLAEDNRLSISYI